MTATTPGTSTVEAAGATSPGPSMTCRPNRDPVRPVRRPRCETSAPVPAIVDGSGRLQHAHPSRGAEILGQEGEAHG
jgi:hypothetical protein